MPISPGKGHIILADGVERIILPIGSLTVKYDTDAYTDNWGVKHPTTIFSTYTCDIDFKELTRCILAKYPFFANYLRAAQGQLETDRQAAKERLEIAKFEAREKYREEKKLIDAKAAELDALAALLDGADRPLAHVNCKASAINWNGAAPDNTTSEVL